MMIEDNKSNTNDDSTLTQCKKCGNDLNYEQKTDRSNYFVHLMCHL